MTASLVIDTIAALRQRLDAERRGGRTIGFVPTMGALHEGHGTLIAHARRDCDIVVVSVFVNPTQFDRKDDLDRYPRTLDADVALCARLGAELVFAPAAAEMYPHAAVCTVEVGALADHLCGRFRPGHFRGVATVVLKLLNIVQPHRAYFGEKDAQQLAIIQRMVADFDVRTSIVPVATVREADGLAMSSRNRLLSPAQRQKAVFLIAALRRIDSALASGERDTAALVAAGRAAIPADPEIRLEYLEVVGTADLQPVSTVTGPVLAAGAMWVGTTRLIDNVRWAPGVE